MERYICIHGHFYQPPRENPWLETIELQDSAYPYHDWNARITAECYAPNAASRILADDGQIVRIVNNYARISYNMGPTLLAWLEWADPETYRAIIEADWESRQRFSGHGSALAQVYNHMILPLGNSRDKETQILWGIHDFVQRFGRQPEGMWLAETAVDLETLDLLAKHGLKFTILAPYQAGQVREIGAGAWEHVSGGRIDPTRAYLQRLPSGREITLFFYDGPISRGVAFEGLLNRGEHLANRLLGAFSERRSWPQLVHIATDGETYGHHHKYGDMALSYALDYIEHNQLARLTNYGEYLELHPPTHEVQVIENTAWSCFHGVERWRSDCGCSTGRPGWNQQWRTPLREALDWLRDTLAPRYERQARRYLKDPWAARNDYISLLLDRGPEQSEAFLARHARQALTPEERVTVWKLLELQRHAMLMYTSCGWFFDDLSGIETVQVIMYAGRVVQLAQELFRQNVEEGFLERLERARSNMPQQGDGRAIYTKWVKPAIVDLPRVGAHYAMSSLFHAYPDLTRIYSYSVERLDYRRWEAGRTALAAGRVRVCSEITQEDAELSFAVLHFGDHNLSGGVRTYQGPQAFEAMVQEVAAAFDRADLPEVIRILDRNFVGLTYSLKSLFRDEQRKILDTILQETLEETGAVYRQLYERHAPLMRFMTDLGIPVPESFQTAAQFALNTTLMQVLEAEDIDTARVAALLEEARRVGAAIDRERLAFTLAERLERRIEQLRDRPDDLALLQRIEDQIDMARQLGADLWRDQNMYYQLLQKVYPDVLARARQGDPEALAWVTSFRALGAKLGVRVPEPNIPIGGPLAGAGIPRLHMRARYR